MTPLQQLASLIGTLTLKDMATSNFTSLEVEALLSIKKKLEVPQNNVIDEVLALLLADKRLQAIKRMRDAYGLGLAEGKDITDQFYACHRSNQQQWLTDTLNRLQPNTPKV